MHAHRTKEPVLTKPSKDAYILSNLLRSCKTTASLTNAFAAYDAVRRPRTQKLVNMSRARGRLLSLQDEDTWDGERVELGKIEEAMVGRLGMDWIWDVDLPREFEKARAVLKERETGELGV